MYIYIYYIHLGSWPQPPRIDWANASRGAFPAPLGIGSTTSVSTNGGTWGLVVVKNDGAKMYRIYVHLSIYIYIFVYMCECVYIYTVIYMYTHTHVLPSKKVFACRSYFYKLKAKESNCHRNGHRTNDRWKNEPRDFIRWKSAFPWPVPLRLDSSSSSESVAPMVSKTIGARSIDMILAFHPIHIKHHKT